MQPMEYWLVAQIALEAVLIALVFFFLTRLKAWRRACADGREGESELATRVKKLAQDVNRLEKQQQSLQEVLEQLTQKVTQLQRNHMGPGFPGQKSYRPDLAWNAGPSLRAQVEALNSQGLSPEDIAQRLRLNLAEVKVALDLCRVRPATSA